MAQDTRFVVAKPSIRVSQCVVWGKFHVNDASMIPIVLRRGATAVQQQGAHREYVALVAVNFDGILVLIGTSIMRARDHGERTVVCVHRVKM